MGDHKRLSRSWIQNLPLFISIVFSFKLKRLAQHFQLEISSSVISKQITVLPCVNFLRRERDYGRWDLMLTQNLSLAAYAGETN